MKKCKHIFFDLDRTLWDFEVNSQLVLKQLIDEHELEQKCGASQEDILNRYYLVNDDLWKRYRMSGISKEELRSSRFSGTMSYFGYGNAELGKVLEEEYIARSPYQKNLLPHTLEALNYLKDNYQLHIITNGFKEVQYIKLENCGLRSYFSKVIISEEVGYNKPDPGIFKAALQQAEALASESAMIGDDLQVDVVGAVKAGMYGIYYNPAGHPHEENLHAEITTLKELIGIF
ncbi:MAG: YjjG family noncanonical pyrimidine nucleotidase [Bacteroidia bacterium]